MSSLGSPNPFFIAGKKAYEVDRSLRFNSGDSTSLTRTPSSTTNRRTYTFSFWFKLGNTGVNYLFEVGDSDANNNRLYIRIDSDSAISIGERDVYRFITTQRIRDFSAWYHLVFAVDTTLSTADNRMRLYLNGEEITSFSTRNNFSQNQDTGVNRNHITNWGRSDIDSHYAGVYFAEINFIDGFQYDPSYFGQTDAITGQWNPKKYIGSYGTNGYYLNFSDNSGTTATTLGKDSSGNGNNFTPNNFSVAAGAGNDSLEDTPTNNFCTLNPLDKMGTVTVSEGNLKVVINGDNASLITGSFGVSSGKWYYEAVASDANGFVGWIRPDVSSYTGYPYQQSGTLLYLSANGSRYKDGDGGASYGASYGNGDIIGCAINLDDNQVTWYKNNSSQGTISITAGSYHPNTCAGGSTSTFTFNFGQRAFSYTPPTGFKALNSANLPDPTIKLPNKHFGTLLWTGTAASHTLTGLNFQPDWFWAKARSQAYHNTLMDSVRGTDRQLWSNRTNDEQTDTSFLTSFNSDGVTLGDNSSGTGATNTNNATDTYVGWFWNAGDTDGKTYTVTVVSDSGNKYRFDGYGTSAVTLDLAEGGTYIFDQSDSSNAGHPLRFSTTANGTHGGGSEYTTGVTTAGTPGSSGAYTQIVVAASAPTLYYYCTQHSGMGGQANTNSTLGSSNFDGTIQTRVKANTTAGFSIITYTGNGSTGSTVGHGLGVKPDAIIIKRRNSSSDWMVYQKEVNEGVSSEDYYLSLNNTNAQTNSIIMLNDTAPTSSVVTLYANSAVNSSSNTYVMYCFSEVAGYSKFGSYTGNGNADGTFVYTGFRPAWVLTKMSSSNNSWVIYDNKRSPINLVDKRLRAQGSFAEDTHNGFDFLSNGFKTRNASSTSTNQNGSTYIYLAFAESPFKNARAR